MIARNRSGAYAEVASKVPRDTSWIRPLSEAPSPETQSPKKGNREFFSWIHSGFIATCFTKGNVEPREAWGKPLGEGRMTEQEHESQTLCLREVSGQTRRRKESPTMTN